MYALQLEDISFQDITMIARDEIEAWTAPWALRSSESNFSNLFIWQPFCQTSYAFVDNVLLIRFHCRRDEEFLLPPLPAAPNHPYHHALSLALEYFSTRGKRFIMRGITPEFRERMEKTMPGRFLFTRERDCDDYVYSADKLASLRGNKYHAKRNHINKFHSLYSYEYEPYNVSRHAEECLQLNTLWHQNKNDETQELMTRDHDAAQRCLLYADQLNMQGAVIRINGEVQAYTMGNQISPDTALIHMEKANAQYHGIYPLINQLFVQNTFSHLTYINREEDLGLEGLRKAKLSYHPEFLIEKYKARLRN
ncbi:MAG: phosphatidylglycerol lysyltransferase domain-containing protein [Peptococcaceae bacterium]|nr:phosphatidylglycerol lysyltransferase domain-containing protein [Peptococcaceae bacterium]